MLARSIAGVVAAWAEDLSGERAARHEDPMALFTPEIDLKIRTTFCPFCRIHETGMELVGGNSQTGNSRGRESMGIPREFPFLKWRFLGIPRNSHTGEVYWLYRGDFYLQGGICFFICIRY